MASDVASREARGALRHRHEEHEAAVVSKPSPLSGGPLPSGAAAGKILYFDAATGVAGDMTIAALLDLGVPFSVVEDAVSALSLDGVGISASRVRKGALAATQFDVRIEAPQHERSYGEIRELLAGADLEPGTRGKAERVFALLARAESQVHGIPVDDVHFHEVGAADSIVDVVGASAALSHLGGRVLCSSLPLGRGSVQSRHGVLPVPAPATLLCLEGFSTHEGGLDGELTTPTGAALLGALGRSAPTWPASRPLRVGLGAGHRDFPERPNVLRVVLAEAVPDVEVRLTHELLACNVDDMTGEELGLAITRLMQAGALDAWAAPIVMKKGRPAWCLNALVTREASAGVAETLLRESSSIGLRRTRVSRDELPRQVVSVSTRYGEVPVKVSGAGPSRHLKPEFDACVTLAESHGVSVRDVIAAALAAALDGDFESA